MHLSFAQLRFIARAMLGLALFTQGVIAAQACDAVNGSAVQAFAVTVSDEAAMLCHEHENVQNTNGCLVHCTQGDQVSTDQIIPPLAPPAAVLMVVDAPAIQTASFSRTSATRVALNTGPPLSVRFCSFQI